MVIDQRQIEMVADLYRRLMDYLPWDEFRESVLNRWKNCASLSKESKDLYIRKERQTGKTTKGILKALAEAMLFNTPIVVVNKKYLISRTMELVNKLELPIVIHFSNVTNCVYYTDHQDE